MLIVTYSEARQNLAKMLDKAKEEGEVLIKRRDGTVFSLHVAEQPRKRNEWPGVETGLSRKQILDAIREGRDRR